MYRVSTKQLGAWAIVCPDCQKSLKGEPDYKYGGTWKAVKRH